MKTNTIKMKKRIRRTAVSAKATAIIFSLSGVAYSEDVNALSKYPIAKGDTGYEYINRTVITPRTGDFPDQSFVHETGPGEGFSGFSDFYNDPSKLKVIYSNAVNDYMLEPGFRNYPTVEAEKWAVYIDLNKDGDFNDDGEKVITAQGNTIGPGDWGVVRGSFELPATVTDSTTGLVTPVVAKDREALRMRVVMAWAPDIEGDPRPDMAWFWGDVEDYAVVLTEKRPNPLDIIGVSLPFGGNFLWNFGLIR